MEIFILNNRNDMNIGNSTGSLGIVKTTLFSSAYDRPRLENAIYLTEEVVIVILKGIQKGLNNKSIVYGVSDVLCLKKYIV